MINTKVKDKFKPFSAFDHEPRFVQPLFGIVPTWELPILRFKASFAGDYYPSFVDKLRAKEQLFLASKKSQPVPDEVVVEPSKSTADFSINFSKLETSRSALGHFEMHYKDSTGNITYREIVLKKIFRKGDVIYFTAYCYLRKSIKTFRVDRVLLLEDLDNGMVFDADLDVFFAAKLLAV